MALNRKEITTELCIIGGGMAGFSAALTAARLGVQVTIIQERPVFGGNASGEIRMWICGAENYKYKETGIVEELTLENYYYNPTKNYPLWDSLLLGKIRAEKNITSLLNCTCFDATTENGEIRSVKAYQMTTQTEYVIQAKWFADCSGDSITAPLTGASYMWGREAKSEYDEPMYLHEQADDKTMGNSCLIQARKTDKKVVFRAPEWAEKVSVEKLKSRGVNLYNPYENFWYIEIGGNEDTIAQAENLNERLLALCLGIWDTIKNSGEFNADEFELEFIGFLPAKRESRRMKGDYVLTANDILSGGKFNDTVAYGGWGMDDHNPDGFDGTKGNYVLPVRNPYGIPYRCLYSENIKNLFFAGRNISMTHMAMSSARVMGTCTVLGQAIGAAAYIAKKYDLQPRGVGGHIPELQQTLLCLDCYLPNIERKVGKASASALLRGANDVLKNGIDRNTDESENRAVVQNGSLVEYVFDKPKKVEFIKLVFDSDLLRETFDMHVSEKHHAMRAIHLDSSPVMAMPKTLVKSFEIVANTASGEKIIYQTTKNKRRNLLIPVGFETQRIALKIMENWGGSKESGVFTFELYDGTEFV